MTVKMEVPTSGRRDIKFIEFDFYQFPPVSKFQSMCLLASLYFREKALQQFFRIACFGKDDGVI
jgi:hypothetical protein